MASYHISKINYVLFLRTPISNNSLFSAFGGNNVNYLYERRTKYQTLFSLSQTYKINE